MDSRIAVTVVVAALALSALVTAGPQDAPAIEVIRVEAWPRFGGPTRDFRGASGLRLADAWPDAGPPEHWSRPLGGGYAGVVGDASRLFTMYRRDDHEVTVAFDAATGRILWEHAEAVTPIADQDLTQGAGPHATPLLDGDLLCTAGVTGRLQCLDAASGRVRWTRELIRDLGGTSIFRGYSSSPVAWRDAIVAAVGGEGRGLVAFHRLDGREIWRAGDFDNTNASPALVDLGGRWTVVAFTTRGVTAVEAASGAVAWSFAHPQRFGDNISLPLSDGRHVFVTSALDGGARLVEAAGGGGKPVAREVWHQPRFGVYFTNVVWVGGHAYGSTGGLGPTFLTALDMTSGQVRWQSRDVPRATLIWADGKAILLTETGELVLARLSPEGVEVVSRAMVLEEAPPAPLALIGTTLYARDQTRLVAFDVGPRGDD